jgi:hypothetical protein
MTSSGIECDERRRLTEELEEAVSTLAALSGEQIRAVIEGRLDDKLKEEIGKVQLEKTEVRRRLEEHIQQHRCSL